MNTGYFLTNKICLNLFIIIFLLNFKNSLEIIHPCKDATALNNLSCFNDVIIFSHRKFRAGHAVTYKSGDTIFEFSVDDSPVSTRLFYGLKKMEDIIFQESLSINNLIWSIKMIQVIQVI